MCHSAGHEVDAWHRSDEHRVTEGSSHKQQSLQIKGAESPQRLDMNMPFTEEKPQADNHVESVQSC